MPSECVSPGLPAVGIATRRTGRGWRGRSAARREAGPGARRAPVRTPPGCARRSRHSRGLPGPAPPPHAGSSAETPCPPCVHLPLPVRVTSVCPSPRPLPEGFFQAGTVPCHGLTRGFPVSRLPHSRTACPGALRRPAQRHAGGPTRASGTVPSVDCPRPPAPSAGRHRFSRFPCQVLLCLPGVSDPAMSGHASPRRRVPYGLPCGRTTSAPGSCARLARRNTPPAPPSVHASPPP
jgi:hypothetical protein